MKQLILLLLLCVLALVGCGDVGKRRDMSASLAADTNADADTEVVTHVGDVPIIKTLYMFWLLDYRPIYESLPFDLHLDGRIDLEDFAEYSKYHRRNHEQKNN